MSGDNCYNSATPGQENITGIYNAIIPHSILTENTTAIMIECINLVIPSDTP